MSDGFELLDEFIACFNYKKTITSSQTFDCATFDVLSELGKYFIQVFNSTLNPK